jgi:non-heme chloroperoxidase
MLRLIGLVSMAAALALPASAQDITGDWQGRLKLGGEELRVILQVTKDPAVGWKATAAVVTQAGIPSRFRVSPVTLDGSLLKFAIEEVSGAYEGKVHADGNYIKGTWIQAQRIPLDLERATKETAWHDPSPHSVHFVTVENNVTLEVLDWGGSGRPLVLLTGLGNDAHIYDNFAPKLTGTCHVYGITRRGFGASSAPDPSINGTYAADRLGDDVLAVLNALKLARPVLAGHSIAGEELSSVGSRHPERVAGLIYMEAGFGFAFYDKARGDLRIDRLELEQKLKKLQPEIGTEELKKLVGDLLQTDLPAFERSLRELQKDLAVMPQRGPQRPQTPIRQAIYAGVRKYTDIRLPVLAIFALPQGMSESSPDEAARAAFEARAKANTAAQVDAFEGGVPSARVVRVPHASHYIFQSNEADVLREIKAFLGGLH